MPRQKMFWWRFYDEMMRDPKIRRRPPAERWAWLGVLTIANESEEPGYLLVEGDVMSIADLADISAIQPKEAATAFAYFKEREMVKDDDRGIPFVVKWWERSFTSDNSTPRTTKHRSKEQRRNVPTNGQEDAQETESSSVDMNSERESKKRVTEVFAAFWDVYPRRDDKPKALTALKRALTRECPEVIIAGAERYRDDPNREAAFTKMPATWLNNDCWGNGSLPARSRMVANRPSHNGTSAVLDEIEEAMDGRH